MQSSPQSERTRRLAEDPIPRLLLRLSLPAMVGMMTQGAYYFVDRVFVAQALNPDAVAGITLAFPYMQVLLAAAMLIGFGAAARVSINLGEKKMEEAEQVLGNAALMMLLVSVVLTVAGEALLTPVLQGLGISGDVFALHARLPANPHPGHRLSGGRLRAQRGDPGRGQCPHGNDGPS